MAVYAPIYRDTVYTYNGEELEYRIESPLGTTILEGVASVKPDGTPAQIYMNRLCEPFLTTGDNPTETGLTIQSGATRTFYLFNSLNDELLETFEFLRAYSDEGISFSKNEKYLWYGGWYGGNCILSDPIRPSISRDMIVPYSLFIRRQLDIEVKTTPTDFYLNLDAYSSTVSSAATSIYFNITSTNIYMWPSALSFETEGNVEMLAKVEDPGPGEPHPDQDRIYFDYQNRRIRFNVLQNTTGKQRSITANVLLGPINTKGYQLLKTVTITQKA